jgi:TetR/AcrR family transcriptional regulator, tetracycline repressor protein
VYTRIIRPYTRTRLSRERIIESALEVVERDGWNSLSMRRLAQQLDVWPMAVYRYFRDKDELLDAISQAAAERVSVPSARGSWRSQMRKLLHESRRALGGQPPSRAQLAPAGQLLSETGIRILHDAGLDRSDAATAWRALFAYALGFPADQQAEFEFGLECLLDGLEARLPGQRPVGERRRAAPSSRQF